MIKGSQIRKADYAIEPILLDRWSPRAMSGEEISQEELMRLFEAARWAPSSFNTQQWRALYARRGTEHWQRFFNLLVDANKAWAKNAAVLVVFISRKSFDYNDEPSITHSYDAGAAWENFALQGFHQGLVVHGMEGFDYERARKDLAAYFERIPCYREYNERFFRLTPAALAETITADLLRGGVIVERDGELMPGD